MPGKKKLLKYLVGPAILYSFVAGVLPMLYALRNSFYNIDFRNPDVALEFVGLANYWNILDTDRFQASLRNALVFSLEGTVGALLLGFFIALFLYYHLRNRPIILSILSTLLILPAVTARISVGYMWKLLYDPSLGLINHLLRNIGIGTVPFLSRSDLALQAIIFTDIWQWAGFSALFLYAGLASIPRDFFEEARVMGASSFQIIRYIVIPNLRGLFLAIFLLKFMISLRSFGLIRVMTGGGPGVATETADMYLYWLAVGGKGKISQASAGAMIMLVITIFAFLIIINIYQRFRN